MTQVRVLSGNTRDDMPTLPKQYSVLCGRHAPAFAKTTGDDRREELAAKPAACRAQAHGADESQHQEFKRQAVDRETDTEEDGTSAEADTHALFQAVVGIEALEGDACEHGQGGNFPG